MLVHTAQVRGRKIAWDKREVVQHGLNADRIKFDLDAEFRCCDSYQVVLCGPSLESPKRYIPDKDMTVAVPPSLMESTGPVSTCLLGYVGGEVRVVTAQERYPLVVVESGFTGPLDPGEEQPDLWAQLMSAEAARIEAELVREAAETARADAEAKRIAAEKARETASAEAVKAANEAAAKAEQAARQAEDRVTAALAEVAKAEQARTEAEKARAAAESSRAEAEAARIAAESKRESAEAKRKADSAKAVADASAATSAANAAAGKADAAAQTATDGEESRVAAETARAKAEQARAIAETGRVEAEATRAANESKRTETFNTNLTSWNGKVDAACKKATDTASNAAQDAKTATDAAIAKTEEAANTAVAKAQTATDSATTAANKAEAAVAQLPLPLGNTLKGEAEATLVHVDDAYPAPLVTTKVLGQSNQQQEPAPSPENPQEITNLNKAELVITGKNLINVSKEAVSSQCPTQPNRYKIENGVITFTSISDWGADYIFFNEANVLGVDKLTFSMKATKAIGTSNNNGAKFLCKAFDSEGNEIKVEQGLSTREYEWGYNEYYKAYCQLVPNNTLTITLRPNIAKIRFGVCFSDAQAGTNVEIRDFQIEADSKATTYEPHKSKSTVIDLKGNELCSVTEHREWSPNTFRDELVIDSEGNVSLIKRVFSAHIDGLEPMSLGATSTFQYFIYAPKTVRPIDGSIAIRSNRFGKIGREPWNFYAAGGSNAALFFTFPLETFANDGELNEWLKSNPIDVNYLGAEPQTILLGKVELPALPEATSNVWNDGNIPANVYVQYLKDVNIAFADLESKLTQITSTIPALAAATL